MDRKSIAEVSRKRRVEVGGRRRDQVGGRIRAGVGGRRRAEGGGQKKVKQEMMQLLQLLAIPASFDGWGRLSLSPGGPGCQYH